VRPHLGNSYATGHGLPFGGVSGFTDAFAGLVATH